MRDVLGNSSATILKSATMGSSLTVRPWALGVYEMAELEDILEDHGANPISENSKKHKIYI